MNKQNHAKILTAYLGRLSIADRRALVSALEAGEYAGQQLGINAQLAAHQELDAAALEAIGNLLAHDLENIEAITARAQK